MKMRTLKKGFFLLSISLLSFAAYSQNTFDLKINELLSNNTENIVDDYGKHSTWFEIYNPTYGTIDIGGCYVTNDVKNPKKYRIPQGITSTKILPHQYLLIWADNIDYHGPLYTNFKLDKDGGYLALYSNDGKTLIDEVTYPELAENYSYARIYDNADIPEDNWQATERITPALQNKDYAGESASEIIAKRDARGAVISVTAMTIVFSVLLSLFFIFKYLARIHVRVSKKKAADAQGVAIEEVAHTGEEAGDIFAAIALALHLYQNDIHDLENMVITIDREDKIYSPWSSKIHTLRKTPIINKNK
jgi:Na+-transporting methylmalonyl-CoA/oxaloacetate decarboxylase gamma subunit